MCVFSKVFLSGGFDFVRSFVRAFNGVSLYVDLREKTLLLTMQKTRAVVSLLSSEDLFFSFFASIFNSTSS
jgi:hypothetical protein